MALFPSSPYLVFTPDSFSIEINISIGWEDFLADCSICERNMRKNARRSCEEKGKFVKCKLLCKTCWEYSLRWLQTLCKRFSKCCSLELATHAYTSALSFNMECACSSWFKDFQHISGEMACGLLEGAVAVINRIYVLKLYVWLAFAIRMPRLGCSMSNVLLYALKITVIVCTFPIIPTITHSNVHFENMPSKYVFNKSHAKGKKWIYLV